MFLRRKALDQIGGFRGSGSYLAEDYAMGRAVEKAGYRVVMSDVPITAWHEGWTLSRFFNRHLRWAVMRRQVSIAAYLAEILLTPVPWLVLLFILATANNQSAVNPQWVLCAFALEWALVARTYSRMTGQRIPLAVFLVNPLREFLTLAIWVVGWFVRVIEWRGKAYRVSAGSRLVAVSPPLTETMTDEARA
jgi:ceramide glucosyltransferase